MLAAQTNLTPDAALKELLAGNGRFAANQLTSVEHDLEILKEHTADKQEPFAALLACADSRVPVELIFDQTIGHIFVARVAGNMVTPEIIATLEYGVAALGVKVVLVLGPTNCGAVKAAMKSDTVPGQISALYRARENTMLKRLGLWIALDILAWSCSGWTAREVGGRNDETAQSLIPMERQVAEADCDDNLSAQTTLADDFEGTTPGGKRYTKSEDVQDTKASSTKLVGAG